MEHDEAVVIDHTTRICNIERFVDDTRRSFIGVILVIVLQVITFAYMWGQLCQVVKTCTSQIGRNTVLIDERILPHIYKQGGMK